MTLDGAREQYAAQLRELDREGLLKEIEQLRRLLTDYRHRESPEHCLTMDELEHRKQYRKAANLPSGKS